MQIKNIKQAESLHKALHDFHRSILDQAIKQYGIPELARKISENRSIDDPLTRQALGNAIKRNSYSAIRRLAIEWEKIEGEKK